jgi:predicted Ser/Thr protein kinase
MNDDDVDDYDDGAETDTNSSTHVRVQEGREAKIPLFLSEDFLPPGYDENMNYGNSAMHHPSRIGGRRNSLVAAHESIDISELSLGKVIGEGAFGKVFKGTWKNKPVAVKVLLHQDLRPDVVSEFETEVQIMSVLNHPNICMLLGACLEPESRALVLELVDQGALWGVLRARRRQINDGIRAKFILDTAKGMNYLHQFKRPILHRDMKSPNLLVQKDFSIKISDFGLARVKAQIQTMTGNCGTVQWMAYVPCSLFQWTKYLVVRMTYLTCSFSLCFAFSLQP